MRSSGSILARACARLAKVPELPVVLAEPLGRVATGAETALATVDTDPKPRERNASTLSA